MNIAISLDLVNPRPSERSWSRAYEFALSICELAEAVGLHSVWFSEHHDFPGGYLPQPLTMAAAVAARTEKIRIGTGLLLAPLRGAPQIAEEAAVVDALSGGRLELGLGPGYRAQEFRLYDVEFEERHRSTYARVDELRELWTGGRIAPEPTAGTVPLWLGYGGAIGARRAGRLGVGLLSLRREAFEPYRAGLAEGGHDPGSARMGGPLHAHVTDDPERDWPKVAAHLSEWADTYLGAMTGPDDPPPRPIDAERWRSRGIVAGLGGFLYGTPEEVAEALCVYTPGLPIEMVMVDASLGTMDEQMVERHIEQLGRLAAILRRTEARS